MVQFNSSFNVDKIVKLTSTPNVAKTDDSNETQPKQPKAEINAVYDAGTSIWHGGDTTRRITLPREIQKGDIIMCFDANLRFLGFDENGYGIYEEVSVIAPGEYDSNRGLRAPGT